MRGKCAHIAGKCAAVRLTGAEEPPGLDSQGLSVSITQRTTSTVPDPSLRATGTDKPSQTRAAAPAFRTSHVMPNTPTCLVCQTLSDAELRDMPTTGRWHALDWSARNGHQLTEWGVRTHLTHVRRGQRRIAPPLTAADPQPAPEPADNIDQPEPREGATGITDEELRARGYNPPAGWTFVTLSEKTDLGIQHWRVKGGVDDDGLGLTIKQAEPVTHRVHIAAKLPPRRATDLKTAFVYGDAQIGWVLNEDEQWEPTHDLAAMDVATQVLADLEAEHGVDDVVDLGDTLDLPGLSKHRSSPSVTVFGSLNKALQSAYEYESTLAALTPNARRAKLRGNHDDRIILYLIDKAQDLVGIRRAGDDKTPVLSLPFLLRADETGFDYSQPYPTGEVWLGAGVRLVHGPCTRPTNNATSDKYLADRPDCSTIYGHTHRPGFTYRTFETRTGPIVRLAGSPGSLCRVDGMVPSSRGGHTDTGRPARLQERWAQGVAVVFYHPTDEAFTPLVEHIPIQDGQAYWRGRRYTARCTVNGEPLS